MVAEYSVLLFAIGIEYKVRKLEVSQKTFIKPATNGNDKRVTNVSVVVSTAEEVMIFLKEFFKGHFFPKENIENLKKWNLILPPPSLFFYGIGLEILFIPRIVSPFKPISEILGFWGQTGSFAWYNPDTDLCFTGTTNQINGAGHSAVVKAFLKIIKSGVIVN